MTDATGRVDRRKRPLPVVAAMGLFAILAHGSLALPQELIIVSFLAAPAAYVLMMYLYFGLARLVLLRQFMWLAVGAVAAIALSLVTAGFSQLRVVLSGWGMLIAAGSLCGYLTRRAFRPRDIYIFCLTAMMGLAIIQYLPFWSQMIQAAPYNVDAIAAEAQRQLTALGRSAERVQEGVAAIRYMAEVVFRLAPAAILLSAVLQLSIGYFFFARWVDREHLAAPQLVPFTFWKMPFGVAPVLLAAMTMRLLGGDTLRLIADNAVLVLATFYGVAGLSLAEYFFRKLHLPVRFRIVVYALMVLIPLASRELAIVVSAVISLIGLADSFADWRKVRVRGLT